MPNVDPQHDAAGPRLAGRIYTVPHGTSFLDALANALLAGRLPFPDGRRRSPLELAGITVLLPTRRDLQSLQRAFLRAARGAALLLPKVKLISHASDDLSPGTDAAHTGEVGEGLMLPAIGKIEREMTLTRLVLQWSAALQRVHEAPQAKTPAQAVRQAKELARLMDMVEMEEVEVDRLSALVRDELSAHWAQTLDFLKIVTESWPGHLAEQGKVSPAGRRKGLMLAEAERLRSRPPKAPVIIAGVTGTVPAASELMRAVLELENGALVLPALDQTLDEESWQRIVPEHPEHPQFGLKKVLKAIGVRREDVATLPGCEPSDRQRARWALVGEAMRPAGTTERWHDFLETVDRREMARLAAGWTILEAPSAADEAEVAALILREAAGQPDRTAMLVTPDRALARRVSVRLRRWNLDVPDLASRPLAATETGAFLDFVIEAAVQRFAPTALMTLLKHPLCRAKMPAARLAEGLQVLELAVFRAPYLGSGLADVAAALDRAANGTLPGAYRGRAVRQISELGWQAARDLVNNLAEIFDPLQQLLARPAAVDVQVLVQAHVEAAEGLAHPGASNEELLWQGEAGEEFVRLFAALLEPTLPYPPLIAAADYPEFYRGLVSEQNISVRVPLDARIFIGGPLEARLQQPDVVILGSLNEGTWPQVADPGPWFNRTMRKELGLPAPEERIGEAAHDFECFLGAETVYLTRAAKIDGVPTVPSRWLLRLQVLLGALGKPAAPSKPWLAWAEERNGIQGPARPLPAPEPRPPVSLRPRKLSVTDIERWIANPYALYAARILALEPLPALGRLPDAAMRGRIVHDALSRFARKFPSQLPDNAAAELVACAQAALVELTGSPRVAAFWAPRLERFAAWFAETEPGRRRGIIESFTEVEGKIVLEGPAGPFTLRARADRIDIGDSGLVITDYKTAANLDPLVRSAEAGRAPQLSLEAAIASRGGFAGIPAQPVAVLRYISAAGGKPPGLEKDLGCDPAGVTALAQQAHEGLCRMIAEFDRDATPYRALRRARFRYDYDDFAHLARVSEWSIDLGEEAA